MAAHAEIPILAFIIHNTSYIIYHHASHACHAPLRRTHMDPFHALRAFGEITGFPEDRRRPEATLRTKHSAYSYALHLAKINSMMQIQHLQSATDAELDRMADILTEAFSDGTSSSLRPRDQGAIDLLHQPCYVTPPHATGTDLS